MIYNPPKRVAPWSIASQYMLDREEFSITPFQLASWMFCCWWSKLLCGQKNFGTEVWILWIRICSFANNCVVYRLFYVLQHLSKQQLPYRIPLMNSYWFSEFGMSVITICSTYSPSVRCTCRNCDVYVDFWRKLAGEVVWSIAGNCPSSWFFQTRVQHCCSPMW